MTQPMTYAQVNFIVHRFKQQKHQQKKSSATLTKIKISSATTTINTLLVTTLIIQDNPMWINLSYLISLIHPNCCLIFPLTKETSLWVGHLFRMPLDGNLILCWVDSLKLACFFVQLETVWKRSDHWTLQSICWC